MVIQESVVLWIGTTLSIIIVCTLTKRRLGQL